MAKSMEQAALASMNMQESLTGVEQIKVLGREQAEVDKAEFRIQAAATAQLRQTFILSLFNEGGLFISSSMSFIILYASTLLMMKQSLSIGQFMMMTAYSGRVFMNTSLITSTWVSLRMLGIAVERIVAIGSLTAEDEDPQRTVNLQRIRGHLVFENVSFHYTDEHPVLDGISFQIEPGEKMLLCGESGSGKSTIIKLILGIYNPQGGRILLDGIPTDCIKLSSLRGCISIVSQNVFLFNDTVINNILYGCQNATRENAVAAAKRARAHDFIVKLENGYETVVGENGARLSGGQAQRLSIARGIVRKAQIYIFDEATAALDPENAELVIEAITESVGSNTCLVIAHRVDAGWERQFDKVLILKTSTMDIKEKANLSS
jgi:ABC-type bacteriocin/lantibiotic exporter with double-glycine peptidase domain